MRKIDEIARKYAITLILAFMASPAFAGGIIPGRWEKVAAEKPGSQFVVMLRAGDRIEGSFKNLSVDGLLLEVSSGSDRLIRKVDIAMILTADKRPGPSKNGVLIGFAVGFGGCVGLAVAASSSDPSIKTGPWVAGCALVPGGVGALIGFAIDHSVKDQILLYEMPGRNPGQKSGGFD